MHCCGVFLSIHSDFIHCTNNATYGRRIQQNHLLNLAVISPLFYKLKYSQLQCVNLQCIAQCLSQAVICLYLPSLWNSSLVLIVIIWTLLKIKGQLFWRVPLFGVVWYCLKFRLNCDSVGNLPEVMLSCSFCVACDFDLSHCKWLIFLLRWCLPDFAHCKITVFHSNKQVFCGEVL